MKKQSWENNFEANFPDEGWCLVTNVGVNPSRDRVKSFISQAIQQAVEERDKMLIEKIETYPHWTNPLKDEVISLIQSNKS